MVRFSAFPTFLLRFCAAFYPLPCPLPLRVVFWPWGSSFLGLGIHQAFFWPLPHPFQEFRRGNFMIIQKNGDPAVHIVSSIISLFGTGHGDIRG